MFLSGVPEPTPFDLRFRLFGFPVCVSPWFWVAGIVLGWTQAQYLASPEAPRAVILLLWLAAIFLSILVHELGHAVVMRLYGFEVEIILYHFGGLAVPRGRSFTYRGPIETQWRDFNIAIAGPVVQLLLAAATIAVVLACGYGMLVIIPLWGKIPWLEGEPWTSKAAFWFVFFLIEVSIDWALFNMLPIFPLDGGRVSRELFRFFSRARGFEQSLILSLLVAVGFGIYCYRATHQLDYNLMLFASLAIGNFQELQIHYGHSGDPRW